MRLNYTTGNYSMLWEMVCKDISQLRYVLHDELQKIKGIERTETFISLEESFNRNVQVCESVMSKFTLKKRDEGLAAYLNLELSTLHPLIKLHPL